MYVVIFLWKILQGLESGYRIHFTSPSCRTGRKAVPASLTKASPACVRAARESSLAIKGVKLFNLLPLQLRNSDHVDTLMFKNHLDIFLSNIPDEPTAPGMARGADSNSLLHQVPSYEANHLYCELPNK